MPPQVSRTGSGTATQQPPISEEQKDAKSTSSSTSTSPTGSATASEPQAQSQKAQEDPKTAARSQKSSQRHATEKRSEQSMQGQMMQKDLQKKVGKQQPDGLWESMKNVANSVAVESFNKTAQIVDSATAGAAMINAAEKANAHVMGGVNQSRDITRQQQAKTISSEANPAAYGQPNPEYKKHAHKPLVTDKFLAEQGIYANLKPKFEDSEKVIQKMDQYNRESTQKDNPKTYLSGQVNAGSMEKLLGPYGYYTTNTDPWVQKQILDVSLHNWRNTPPEARQALHAGDKNSPALNGNFNKNWINPPRTSVSEEDRLARSQVVQDPPLPGAYMQPGYQGPRGGRPDPAQVYAKGVYDFQKAGFDVINSIGVTHGTPRHSPTVFGPSGNTTGTVQTSRSAPPPERNVAEERPVKSSNTPGYTNSNAPPQSKKSSSGVEPAKGSEIKQTETPSVNRMSKSDNTAITDTQLREQVQKEISDRNTIRRDLVKRGANVLEAEGIDHVSSNHKSVTAGLKRIAGDDGSPRQKEAQKLLDQISEQTERINHLSGAMARPQRSTLK